jgi:heme-degrading monooxygenase HmoA
MHIQIITFRLRDMDEATYRQFADEVAPAYSEVAGLLSKVWLADSPTSTYGGVLFWQGRPAMERFARSDMFQAVERHPNFADVSSADFEVLEGPSRITRGLVEASA